MTKENTIFAKALHHTTVKGNVYALVETNEGSNVWKKQEDILPTDKPVNGWLASLSYYAKQIAETRLESQSINERLERIEKLLEVKQ